MSGMPIMIGPGAIPARVENESAEPGLLNGPTLAGAVVDSSTSEWFDRTRHYAVEAVANAERRQRHKIETRLDKASRRWTSIEIVRNYPANADGERRFREEADVLAAHRYVGWLETGLAGQPFGARLLVGTGLGSFARRDWLHRSPKRTVTWVLQVSLASSAGPAKAIRVPVRVGPRAHGVGPPRN
jgi:hypothetical protein